MLAETLCNEAGFEPGDSAINTTLLLEDESASNYIADVWCSVNEGPGSGILDGSKFLEDCSMPGVAFWASQGLTQGGRIWEGGIESGHLVGQVDSITDELSNSVITDHNRC